MIKTVAGYREYVESIKADLKTIWDDTQQRDRNELALKLASSLNLSQTTIFNYLRGLVSDPETALKILEKHKELFS